MHVIQRFVYVDMLLGGRTYHSAEQLRDVSIVNCPSEGHHNLGSGAVPAGGKRFLKENHFDPLVIGDS